MSIGLRFLHAIGKLFGIGFKVDGLPFGATPRSADQNSAMSRNCNSTTPSPK